MLDENQQEHLRELAKTTMPVRQIARELEVDFRDVYRAADKMGISIRKTEREVNAKEMKSIRDRAYDMKPGDAVEYLLDLLSELTRSRESHYGDYINKPALQWGNIIGGLQVCRVRRDRGHHVVWDRLVLQEDRLWSTVRNPSFSPEPYRLVKGPHK